MYEKELYISGELICRCKHCAKEYNLYESQAVAKKNKTRVLRCPHKGCLKKIGQLN